MKISIPEFRSLLIILLLIIPGLSFPQKYVLVWSDEFNTPGLPDSTKWDYEVGKVRNNELQYYTKARLENTRIEDTVLIIEARKEYFAGANYTSGSIISKGAGDWKYGKIEIRAKVPTGKGTWPALWMLPTYAEYGGWPKSGEIDIMEYIGVEPQNLYFTAHFEGTGNSGHASYGSGPKTYFQNPWEDFIKYILIWTPEKIEWYANDIRFYTFFKTGDDYRTWPFDKEFYLILNLAYGGSWGGYDGVDDSLLPHRFLIDYVRVYQLQESEGPFSLSIEPAQGGRVEVDPQLDFFPEGTEVTLTAIPNDGFVFRGWKHQSRANPFTFTVNKNTTVIPDFYNETELLTNGKFDFSWQPWTFYVYNAATAEYHPSIEDGKLLIDITKSPGTDWQLGFQETGLPIRKGNYLLSFDAAAAQSKSLLFTVSKNYPDWGAIVTKRVTLSSTVKSYEIPIEMPYDENNARFYFGIGNFSGQFTIDNISLKRNDPPATLASSSETGKFGCSVFPNPAGNSFTIDAGNLDPAKRITIRIYNAAGMLVLTEKTNRKLTRIYPGLDKGTYLVELNDGRNREIIRLFQL